MNHLFKEAMANSQCILDSAHHQGGSLREKKQSPKKVRSKKPYHGPTFRYERVFETQALSCSKLPGQMKCGTSTNKLS
jgi:hypothetical protein